MNTTEPLQPALGIVSDESIRATDLDFYGLLRRQINEGRLFFNQRRAVIFDAEAIGTLRQQLVETLGPELAMGALMRFGYAQGEKDAQSLGQTFNWETELDWLAAGPTLHMLEGVVQVEPQKIEFDRASGHFYMKGIWRNSYEAEEHVKLYGLGDHPVCWTLAGYASGYGSYFFGSELLAIETECVGKGDECCRWEIRPVNEWGSEAELYRRALKPVNLLGEIQTYRQLQEQSQAALTNIQESQQLLRTIIDATPDWIFIKDQQHRYHLVNQGYANSLQLSPEDFVGKNDLELGFPEDIVKGDSEKGIRGFWADDREVMDRGQAKFIEVEPAVVDGQPIYLSTRKIPLRDREDQVWGVLGFVQDITTSYQAQEALARRATELEAVAQVSAAASTILEMDRLLWEVANLTKKRFGLYHAHIYLLNEIGDRLNLVAGAGEVGRQMVAEGWSIAMARQQSLVAQAARTRQAVVVNDVQASPDWLSNPLLPDTRSEMAVPMVAGDMVLGILDLQSDQVNFFDAEDIFTKTILSSQVASAVQNVRSFEAVVQAQQELAVINKILQEIPRQFNMETLLETVYEQIQRVIVTDTFFVGLYNPSQNSVEYPLIYANHRSSHQSATPVKPGSNVEKVLQTGQPILINRTPSELGTGLPASQNVILSDQNKAAASLLFVPLRLGEQLKGVMSVQSHKFNSYDERDLTLLSSIANQLIVGIENVRLYQQTEARARREQTLREITARVRSSVDVDNIMRITAQELGRALGRPAFIYLDEDDGQANASSQEKEA